MDNPVLLLHGAIGAKEQLEPLAALLKDQGKQVHTMSFVGHGDREDDGAPFSMQRFAEDVLHFLDENNIARADIFGYSMGGYVAMYLAKHHSDRVGNITTLGTKFHWTPEIAAKETKMLDADKIEQKVPKFAIVLEKRHSEAGWKNVLNKTQDLLISLGDDNTLKPGDYAAIQHDSLILLGESDNMVTGEESERVADELPNGRFLVLKNSEHPIEKADIAILAKQIIRSYEKI